MRLGIKLYAFRRKEKGAWGGGSAFHTRWRKFCKHTSEVSYRLNRSSALYESLLPTQILGIRMVFIPTLMVVLCSDVATSTSVKGDKARTGDNDNTTIAVLNALVSHRLSGHRPKVRNQRHVQAESSTLLVSPPPTLVSPPTLSFFSFFFGLELKLCMQCASFPSDFLLLPLLCYGLDALCIWNIRPQQWDSASKILSQPGEHGHEAEPPRAQITHKNRRYT